MEETKPIYEATMSAEQFMEAQLRYAVLISTEKICENIFAKTTDVNLTYQEFCVAIKELIKATNYYKNMCNAFIGECNEPTLDCEILIDSLMSEDYNFDGIIPAISLALYGIYNRFYSASIMLIGIANQKFPEKSKSIRAMYKKLSPNFNMPKFTTATSQEQHQMAVAQEISEKREALNEIK